MLKSFSDLVIFRKISDFFHSFMMAEMFFGAKFFFSFFFFFFFQKKGVGLNRGEELFFENALLCSENMCRSQNSEKNTDFWMKNAIY